MKRKNSGVPNAKEEH